MTDHEKAIEAAEWLKSIGSRIQFHLSPTNPPEYPWVQITPYIAGIADSHSSATDEMVIAEAKRLGWAG